MQYVQFKEPSRHSCNNPRSRIVKKIMAPIRWVVDVIRGIRRTTSISNTRKITASIKNRREKGWRADF